MARIVVQSPCVWSISKCFRHKAAKSTIQGWHCQQHREELRCLDQRVETQSPKPSGNKKRRRYQPPPIVKDCQEQMVGTIFKVIKNQMLVKFWHHQQLATWPFASLGWKANAFNRSVQFFWWWVKMATAACPDTGASSSKRNFLVFLGARNHVPRNNRSAVCIYVRITFIQRYVWCKHCDIWPYLIMWCKDMHRRGRTSHRLGHQKRNPRLFAKNDLVLWVTPVKTQR